MGRKVREADRQGYIHNYARTLLGQIKDQIPVRTLVHYDSAIGVANHMYHEPSIWRVVLGKLDEEKDETLGRLACAGLPGKSPGNIADTFDTIRLHQVSNSALFSPKVPKWFNIKKRGRELVLYLAAQAVFAAMADNIYADMKKVKYSCPGPDYSKVGLPA
jgi:hypothetical protein